ncbi:hypothetical protein J6590_068284 [Homalodisca vitripennis]|nr:hypothetical protein J6590_068284 [Homalodisca vitripennis]
MASLLIKSTPARTLGSFKLPDSPAARTNIIPFNRITNSHTIIRREYFVKRNILQELNASRAEIVIRWKEQVAVLLVNQSQPTTRSTRPPHFTGRLVIGEAAPRLLAYHIPPRWLHLDPYWTSDYPTTSSFGLQTTASTPVNQLIEMSTVIRSRASWLEREKAVLECRRQRTDVQLRSSSSSSNPLLWDLE